MPAHLGLPGHVWVILPMVLASGMLDYGIGILCSFIFIDEAMIFMLLYSYLVIYCY
jgi:hypothetical protein